MSDWNNADVQGLVFSGYGDTMQVAAYHLLRIEQAAKARAWVAGLTARITPGMKPAGKPAFCLNVAFTRSGLELLGVRKSTIDETFEPAFQEGMTSPRRSRILGDEGSSAPERWQWGNPAKPVDVLLMLYAPDAVALQQLTAAEEQAYTAGSLVRTSPPVLSTPLSPNEPYSREHFGFADGISQPTPVLADTDVQLAKALETDPDAVPAGEFVFGYTNAYGNKPLVPGRNPAKPDATDGVLGMNGSFLVVRQFEQDVSGLWNFLLARANGDRLRAERLAAKMVGRWPSGAMVRERDAVDPGLPSADVNRFDFTDDRNGTGVPIGSHMRRSNPRGTELADDPKTSLTVARRHRILRRARSYGPFAKDKYQPDAQSRGLFFIAVNANIERQFEFIMHSWIHNPVFGSLYQETDPLVGNPGRIVDDQIRPAQTTTYTIPATPLRERVHQIPRFVSVVGGAYFFLPGIEAIRRYLADQV
jgi:Dyp-type peroxidase family